MLNFALGPVMSSDLVLKVGSEQTPYFRTPEFSKITLENEKLMKEMLFADEDSKVIFLTGSGTSGMEATVMNVFTENDKVLVVNGGGFGQRFVDLCKLHNIDCDDIKIDLDHVLLLKCWKSMIIKVILHLWLIFVKQVPEFIMILI